MLTISFIEYTCGLTLSLDTLFDSNIEHRIFQPKLGDNTWLSSPGCTRNSLIQTLNIGYFNQSLEITHGCPHQGVEEGIELEGAVRVVAGLALSTQDAAQALRLQGE